MQKHPMQMRFGAFDKHQGGNRSEFLSQPANDANKYVSGCRTHAPTVKLLEDTVAGARHGDSVAKAQSALGQGNTCT
jgi:hypothetical protein